MIQKLEHCVVGTDYGCSGATFSEVIDKVNEVIDYIDSLPEEKPSEDLEEEMDRYFDTMQVFEHENIFEETFHKIARHFAEWQKEQMMKDAVEGEVVQDMRGLYHAKSVAFVSDNSYNFGDKVRIIIVKED